MSTAYDLRAAGEMKFSGPVTAIAVPSLIHSICATQETGVLYLRDGRLQKAAYVRAGQLVFARSNDPDDRLGELFLRRGVLSVRGFERCTEQVMRTRSRLGGLLVKEGLITPEDLIEGVKEQVKEIIYSMFQWTRGDYVFQMGTLPTDEVITLRVNTSEMIRTGIGRIRTWSRIRQAVGGLDCHYQYVSGFDEKLLDLQLLREEERLLQFLLRPASVGEVCDTLHGTDFETCRMIWAFHVMGALQKLETEPPPAPDGDDEDPLPEVCDDLPLGEL